MRFSLWKKRLDLRPQFIRKSPTIVLVDQSHAIEKIKGRGDALKLDVTFFQAIDLNHFSFRVLRMKTLLLTYWDRFLHQGPLALIGTA